MLRRYAYFLTIFTLVFGISSRLLAADLAKIKERGVLKVACEPGFLPFEMRTKNGDYIGFDIDMMRAFGKYIGVSVEFIATKWDGIIPGLMAGKYDVIVSGMTITDARKKAVLFSDPYYQAGLNVLLKKDLIGKINKLEDLDKKGKTIAVKLGTTGDIFTAKRIKNAEIRKLDVEADAAQAVLLGKADAFIYDKPYLTVYASTKPGQVGLLTNTLSDEYFGLAARKQDKELVARFNAFLKSWKSDKNGYDQAYENAFVKMTWKKHFPNLF